MAKQKTVVTIQEVRRVLGQFDRYSTLQ